MCHQLWSCIGVGHTGHSAVQHVELRCGHQATCEAMSQNRGLWCAMFVYVWTVCVCGGSVIARVQCIECSLVCGYYCVYHIRQSGKAQPILLSHVTPLACDLTFICSRTQFQRRQQLRRQLRPPHQVIFRVQLNTNVYGMIQIYFGMVPKSMHIGFHFLAQNRFGNSYAVSRVPPSLCNEPATVVYTAGAFVLQHHTKACTSDTILATIEECGSAMALLDPGSGAVTSDGFDDAPKGCSRIKGKWYFNEHATGALDDAGEQLSACNCDQYQISKHRQSWYNKKWTANGKICGGKPVYSGSSSRFLIYDSGGKRWEFSSGSCKTSVNWFPGNKGTECPSDNTGPWKAACTKPVTIATTTTKTATTENTLPTTTTTAALIATSKPGESEFTCLSYLSDTERKCCRLLSEWFDSGA